MANGDDKKKNLPAGKHSGYTGYVDNLGGAQYYGEEVDEGGGNYSISGQTPGKTLISREAARLKAIEKGWVDPNISQEDYNKKVDEFYKKRNTTAKEYAAGKTDKQTYTQKSANNVANTKNDNGNGNIATATATGGSVGNISIGTTGGTGTGTTTSSSKKTQATIPTKDDGGSSTKPSTSSTTGNTRGYSGNSPFNQATATATGGSVGDITINVPGGGGGSGSGPGGGGPGKISDLLGGIKPNMKQPAFKKTTGITQNTPGGKTPYKFRGLENQFQSWQMNRYDNDTTT